MAIVTAHEDEPAFHNDMVGLFEVNNLNDILYKSFL